MDHGGNGGNGNTDITDNSGAPTFCTLGSSGTDGGRGENCGLVNIFNYLTIYAYGGAGGSALAGDHTSSGGGAGGYPAARNRSVVGAGGRWC